MKTAYKIADILIVLIYIAAMVALFTTSLTVACLLFSIPAGWGVGGIIGQWIVNYLERDK